MNTNVQNFLFGTMMTVVGAAILQSFEVETTWPIILGVFLFSYPWKMPNDDVYSLWGGSSSRNIYSLLGVYQRANGDANCLIGVLIYQHGTDTDLIFGISLCQIARRTATQWVSITFFQKGQCSADQGVGIVFCQIGKESRAEQVVGIAIYQQGGIYTEQYFGIPLWQKVVPPPDKHAMS